MLGDFFPPGWVNFPVSGAIGRAMPLVRYYSSIKDFLGRSMEGPPYNPVSVFFTDSNLRKILSIYGSISSLMRADQQD